MNAPDVFFTVNLIWFFSWNICRLSAWMTILPRKKNNNKSIYNYFWPTNLLHTYDEGVAAGRELLKIIYISLTLKLIEIIFIIQLLQNMKTFTVILHISRNDIVLSITQQNYSFTYTIYIYSREIIKKTNYSVSLYLIMVDI